MIIRRVDGTGDWLFGKGLASYAREEQAIEENVQTRLLSWVGDCFFAKQDGIDWRGRLDVGQESALKAEIRSSLLKAYGVVAVPSVDLTKDAQRRVIITYTIETIFGQKFTGLLTQAGI